MNYGTTTVICGICKKKNQMFGWLPTAWTIWNLNEGLECCNQQTNIISQEVARGEEE